MTSPCQSDSSSKADLQCKILLYGYYGCGNAGDDLLLSVILSRFLGWDKMTQITVKCLLPPNESVNERVHFDDCEKILADRTMSPACRLLSYLYHLWKSLKGASALVYGGGTLFHADQGSPKNLIVMAAVTLLARLRGAQVYALGIGVNEIRGLWPRLLMSIILRLSRDFAVRDDTSYLNCRTLSSGDTIRQTADLVFSYDLPPELHSVASHSTIGLALAASALGKQADDCNGSFGELSRALNLMDRADCEVHFLSFQELEFDEVKFSDSELHNQLVRAGLESEIPIVLINETTDDITKVFRNLNLIISMRFHALVLAARFGIPFIGIGHDPKLKNLCSLYQFPFIAFETLKADDLIEAVERASTLVPDARITHRLALAAQDNFRVIEKDFS